MKHEIKTEKIAKPSRSSSRGFTLFELIVVISIAAASISLILASYHRIGDAGTMERAANRLAQDIRAAQAYAMSVAPGANTSASSCGFGVHAPDPSVGDPNSYLIYSKVASASLVPCGTTIQPPVFHRDWNGGALECFSMSGGALAPAACGSCPAACAAGTYYVSTEIVKHFIVPEAGRVKFSTAPLNDVFFEPPDPATYVLPSGGASADFRVESIQDSALYRTVKVFTSGRVEIENAQILSKPCVPLNCKSFTPEYECGTWPDGCGGDFTCPDNTGQCATLGDICCASTHDTNCYPASVPAARPFVGLGYCYASAPAAPSNIKLTSASANEIDVQWQDNAVNESRFDIQKTDASCAGTWEIINGSGEVPPSSPITDTPALYPSSGFPSAGLSPDTKYCYQVRAWNPTGPSVWVPTPPDASMLQWTRPDKPSLSVSPCYSAYCPLDDGDPNFLDKSHALRVTWSANNSARPAMHLRLERCKSSAVCGSCQDGRVAATTIDYDSSINDWPANNNYFDTNNGTGLLPNTKYAYWLYAVNDEINPSGDSAPYGPPANLTCATTRDVVPVVPQLLPPTSVSASEIDIQWVDDQDMGYGEETGFQLFKCQGSSCNPALTSPVTINSAPYNPLGSVNYPASPGYPDTGLTPDTPYSYCVKAQNAIGLSIGCSNIQTQWTRPNPPQNLSVISAVSPGLTCAAASQIALQWNHSVPGTTVTETKIYRAPASGGVCGTYAQIGTVAKDGSAGDNTYTDNTAEPNAVYCYEAAEHNVAGDSVMSNPTAPIAVPDIPPVAPNITLTAMSNVKVDISWQDNAVCKNSQNIVYAEEQDFYINRCQGTTCNPLLGTQVAIVASVDGTTLTYSNSGLTQDTDYTYCVRAHRGAVYSGCTGGAIKTIHTPMQGHFTEVNGVVVFEAEEFANNLSPRSSHSWTFNTGLGSSGTGYMEATPESNASLSAGGTSPELQYDIVFNTAGTYYVWVSGWAQNNGSDTVHSGLDGSFANSDCIYNFTNGVWSWQQNHKSGCSGGASRATVNVAAGSRVFSLWMNEDSFRADRVLLVNDSAYTPNPPVITINATAVVSGQSTVSWSITNPSKKTCTASSNPSGLWSGSKASSGSETVSGITGNITLTLNCVGPLGESDSKSVTVGPFAFHLTNGGDASVNSGSLVTVPIHAVLDGGTAQNVTFSRTKPVTPPTGMTFSFSPASCLPISSPGCLSTLTVNTTASTPPGTYQVEITGTASSLTQTTTFNVTVNAFDFSLANSGNISVTQGAASGSNTITATLVSGTTQSVSFTVSGLPSGATYSIANCSPTCPTTLTINGLATAAVGTYSITVTGTGGGQTHPTTFTLNIVAVGSPVAAYGMNEASGNTTADASGNGNTGTLQNAPSRVASKSGYGNAISFNGTSQYVRVNDAATLDLGNSGTVMAWVKLNTLGVWNDIFSKGNGSNDRDFNYSIEIDNANHAYCNLGNGTSSLANPVISTATVAASVFTHVACVWNGTTVTIYINGTPNGSVAQTITPAGNATPLGIGVWGVVDYMHGVIDEARIYNVALTQAQIQAAMNTPL